MNNGIRVKAPASIANLGPLFDYAAMAISYRYDYVSIRLLGEGVSRVEVKGGGEVERKIVYHAANTLLQELGEQLHVRINLEKNIPLVGGLGGGGPVAAATVYALNRLLGDILGPEELVGIAGRAQSIVAGEPHYETAAASLEGGLVILTNRPPDLVIRMEPPAWLRVVLFLPCGELREKLTIRKMREVLPGEISMKSALEWLGSTLRLVTSLQRGDWENALKATANGGPIEEYRAKHIPGYAAAKKAALGLGAIGFNISGAGPTLFALVREGEASDVEGAVSKILKSYWGCVETVLVEPSIQGVSEA